MKAVGVVGTGAMGLAIVERFVAAGLRPSVYDVSPAAVQRAVDRGAVAKATAAEVAASSEAVSVMVRTDDQMLDSVLGLDGVLSGLRSGGLLLLHSTINPSTTRTIAEAARAGGVHVADACIAGVPEIVRSGQAVCLAGGDTELIERITPHLLLLVSRVIHMGPLGCGNVAKVVRNFVNLTGRLVLREGLQMMYAAGIEREQAVQMLELIYSNRLGEEDLQLDRPRPQGNLFDAILPLARQIAADLKVETPIARVLPAAEADVSV